MSDIGARDIIVGGIVTLAFGLTIYITAVTTMDMAKRNQDAAIANAVSEALEDNRPMMTCKDSDMLRTIRSLAENGAHVNESSFDLWINMGDGGNHNRNVPDGG